MNSADLVKLLLALVAVYCGGAWLWLAAWFWLKRKAFDKLELPAIRREVQTNTFHLGLCFILALGFLGHMVY